MINILDNLRTHLIDKGIVTSDECKINIPDTSDEQVCLWQYGGYSTDIGQQPTIQIKVFSKSQATADTKITSIYDELIADGSNKIKVINGVNMRIIANQQPFFLEKDEQNRFIFVFNITITAFR